MGKYIRLLVFLLLVILTSAFATRFETGDWYIQANKPEWMPPGWLFGVVWSLLYLLMAFAAWLVSISGHYKQSVALSWWMAQLVLNGAWSWIFFGLHRVGWALGILTLLLFMVLMTTLLFSRIRKLAGGLMVPYVLWLMFAWVLNFVFWRMNGGSIESIMGGL